MKIQELTVIEAQKLISEKKLSSVELVQMALDQIEKYDDKIKAFITVTKDEALKKAKEIDERIAKGEKVGRLAGIPYSAKDVFVTKGIKTTASSKILDNYIPQYTATVIAKVDAEDAILIGKTNCDPFGFGSSTENSGYFTTHNPWNLDYVPGGSSGGSAAALSAGMGLFSIAEDTGGSIRQPASFTNITGIKVTYGRVSRYGGIAYGSSLDSIGHMTKTVEDAAYILEITAGEDEHDSTTLPATVPAYTKSINKDLKGLKIGMPKEYFTEDLNEEVAGPIKDALKVFEGLGAEIVDISLPYTKYAIAAYYIFGLSEVSANLSRYDAVRFGPSAGKDDYLENLMETRSEYFGEEEKRRIMLGTYTLSAGYYDAYYKKAMKVRTLLIEDFKKAFEKVDAFIAPVSPTPPFKIGANSDDPLKMWLADAYTVTLNPTGSPGLAIPCGFTKDNLPIGMQIIGPQLSEELLFNIGNQYQKVTDWHKKMPELSF